MIHCVLVWFLKPVPLSENDGTLDQQLEACRSVPQRAKIFLGTVGAWLGGGRSSPCSRPPPPFRASVTGEGIGDVWVFEHTTLPTRPLGYAMMPYDPSDELIILLHAVGDMCLRKASSFHMGAQTALEELQYSRPLTPGTNQATWEMNATVRIPCGGSTYMGHCTPPYTEYAAWGPHPCVYGSVVSLPCFMASPVSLSPALPPHHSLCSLSNPLIPLPAISPGHSAVPFQAHLCGNGRVLRAVGAQPTAAGQ